MLAHMEFWWLMAEISIFMANLPMDTITQIRYNKNTDENHTV